MNDPWSYAAVALALAVAWIYVRGVKAVAGSDAPVARGDATTFLAGIGILVLALSPPAQELAHRGIVQHMAQHIALVVGAPPLLALARPLPTLLAGLPQTMRRRLATQAALSQAALGAPAFLAVSALQAVVFWGWHEPALYDAAVRHDALHALEHAMFLVTAMAFWWGVVHAARAGERGYVCAIVASVATMIQGSMLGLLMLVAHAPWYGVYPATSDSLAQQQSAAALMWGTTGTVYMLAAAILFWRLLESIDHEAGIEGPPA